MKSVREINPSLSDFDILQIANAEERIIITMDKDFGELVFRLQLPHRGILLIRIEEDQQRISYVAQAITTYYSDMLNKFSVINEKKLRIKE